MPENQPVATRRQFALCDMEVGTAHAACRYPKQYVTGLSGWLWYVLDLSGRLATGCVAVRMAAFITPPDAAMGTVRYRMRPKSRGSNGQAYSESTTASIVPGALPSSLLFTKIYAGSDRCLARISKLRSASRTS